MLRSSLDSLPVVSRSGYRAILEGYLVPDSVYRTVSSPVSPGFLTWIGLVSKMLMIINFIELAWSEQIRLYTLSSSQLSISSVKSQNDLVISNQTRSREGSRHDCHCQIGGCRSIGSEKQLKEYFEIRKREFPNSKPRWGNFRAYPALNWSD